MNSRQVELFKNIVAEYLISAKAVGSKLLVDKYAMDVSSATIRNDMAELEHLGLISHPHTSAGRIPTQKGYEYYISNHLQEKEIPGKDKGMLDDIKNKTQQSDLVSKCLAKKIAELTGSATIIAFSKNDIFYTGLSNLFSQPEFTDLDVIYSLSEVVDHLDEVIDTIFDDISDTQIKVGRNSCFADNCSSILTKSGKKLFGILGPMRMDYQRNLSLINYTRELI